MHGQVVEIDCEQPGRALEILRAVNGLEEVALYGSSIHAVVPDCATYCQIIEDALKAEQIAISSMQVIPPSLEDVFIARARG